MMTNFVKTPSVAIMYATGAESSDPFYAARLLAFTKNTRLNMNPDGFQKFLDMSEEELMEEIEYMARTIPSSWEFLDISFMITDVSRAAAQQITRTRTASFAMQSQRVTDVSEANVHLPDNLSWEEIDYKNACHSAMSQYSELVKMGCPKEAARNVLPIGVTCNLVAKYNLRSLVDLIMARESHRAQGEYREVAGEMKRLVLEMWPWAAPFFVPKQDSAIDIINEVIGNIREGDDTISGDAALLSKAIDLIKKG